MKINSNLKQIVKIANKLDELELFDSANTLTKVAVKLAQSFDQEYDKYISRTERENEMGLNEMPMPEMERDSSLADLENDPLMIRYKMEYKKVKKQVQMKNLPMNLNNFKKITKLIQGLI